MSPEQVRGERLDARTDVWSFGVVLYEMLSGQRPFAAKTSVEILSAILEREPPPLPEAVPGAPALQRLVRRCLEKDAALRYPSMQELLTDLRLVRVEIDAGGVDRSEPADSPAVPAAPAVASATAAPSLGPIGGRWWRAASRFLPAAALALLLAVAVALTVYALGSRRSAPGADARLSASAAAAYDDYVRGRVMVSDESRESNEAAIELLERAVAADPGLAPAFAELAFAYNIKSFFYAPPEERVELGIDAGVAVEKALQLDPNLADAHHARGVILWTHANRFPHLLAIQSFRRALALNPDLHETHHRLGMVYLHVGRLDEALEELERALAINPANTMARFRIGIVHTLRGEHEEALTLFEGIPTEINPALVQGSLALAYHRLGRTAEAAGVVDRYLRSGAADEGGTIASIKAILLAAAGQASDAEEAIRRALEIGKGYGHFHHTAHNAASAYALLGRKDEALDLLWEAAEDGYPCLPCFEHDATLDGLRGEAPFLELMAKLGLQRERYQAAVATGAALPAVRSEGAGRPR